MLDDRPAIQLAGAIGGYLYVLRVPMLAWLVLVGLPWLALPQGASLGPLLGGLFDIVDPSQAIEFPPFLFVTLAALMAGATIGLTTRLIICDANARFGLPAIPRTRGVELAIRLFASIVPLSIVGGVWVASLGSAGLINAMTGTFIGAAIFYVLMKYGHPWIWNEIFVPPDYLPVDLRKDVPNFIKSVVRLVTAAAILQFRMLRWFVRVSPAGFVDNASRRIRGRHVFALFQFFFSLLLYGAIFLLKRNWYGLDGVRDFLSFGQPPQVSTLALILILATMVCWGLSWLSFVFDRFRVPLLVPIVVYTSLVGLFPQGDHFFQSLRHSSSTPPVPLTAAEVLKTRAGRPAIVVSATGGGIQAGAWTARVLAGLHYALAACGDDFDESVLLVSAVSGGSVGAMYFVDQYASGRFDPGRTAKDVDGDFAVKAAEASSLDEVAWGLVYPDLAWTLFPYLKGVWLGWPPHLVNGPNLVSDRGYALENTWRRSESLATATLDTWRADVAGSKRPAVIFNATIAETGDRLLLGTTALKANPGGHGRLDFSDRSMYKLSDLSITTAARLSATFPYVSPPARILRDGVFRNEYHVVDGGYYDNYGTATLVEWLDEGLTSSNTQTPSAVLILEIRSSAPAASPEPGDERGTVFETTQPLTTMVSVRGTGQLSRSDVDVNLVASKSYGAPVSAQVITFEEHASDDSPDISPPLSWHLTPSDRGRLRKIWMEKRPDRVAVHHFLRGVNADERCVE